MSCSLSLVSTCIHPILSLKFLSFFCVCSPLPPLVSFCFFVLLVSASYPHFYSESFLSSSLESQNNEIKKIEHWLATMEEVFFKVLLKSSSFHHLALSLLYFLQLIGNQHLDCQCLLEEQQPISKTFEEVMHQGCPQWFTSDSC